jgi:hypothetical protein
MAVQEEGNVKRKLSEAEHGLVSFLLGKEITDTLEADPKPEGMGSLRFVGQNGRKFGSCVAETTFTDADGVLVSAALYLDQFGELFELDLWKVDFSPVQRIPPVNELENSK